MNESIRQQHNASKLLELYPAMRRRVAAIIADLEGHKYRPRIQDAYRSPADQLRAFNSGHSKLRYGFHNVTGRNGNPESLAVDLLDDDAPLGPPMRYLVTLAASAEAHGCTTGIRWGLPPKLRDAIDAALAAHNFEAPVKVGWDPTHIEPVGITAAQAKAGVRPS